jgi:hypothetical protein
MAYLDSANLAQNPDFRGKVRVASVNAAVNIGGEPPSDPPNPNKDEARKKLAFLVINNSEAYVDRFSFAVITNAVIAGQATTPELILDDTIQFVVNSVWDDIAGV